MNTAAEAADKSPIVIAHRGASGYRPEHTFMSYSMAMEQGADFVEPDLVVTKDGVLVARHDIYLSDSTDVAAHPEFADRKRVFEGHDDWYVFDFTLAELRTLKARQPRPKRGTMFDGIEPVPTFDEIVDFAIAARKAGKTAGFYIEMKRPAMFTERGLDPTEKLIAGFKRLADAGVPLYFQCFESDYILKVKGRMPAPLIWLIEGKEDRSNGTWSLEVPLDLMAGKVDGIGPNKALLVDSKGEDSGLVAEAHRLGMQVHVWTVRDDQVPVGIASSRQELKWLFAHGVDGVFADFPDTAIDVRNNVSLVSPERMTDD